MPNLVTCSINAISTDNCHWEVTKLGKLLQTSHPYDRSSSEEAHHSWNCTLTVGAGTTKSQFQYKMVVYIITAETTQNSMHDEHCPVIPAKYPVLLLFSLSLQLNMSLVLVH